MDTQKIDTLKVWGISEVLPNFCIKLNFEYQTHIKILYLVGDVGNPVMLGARICT
jgi:hypothetical protein